MKQKIAALICILIGALLWFFPGPHEVSQQGWHLFAIFVTTMMAIMAKPFPMGVIALMALALCIATRTLTFAEAFSGFSNEVVWLIVLAFFIAKGFISTGLGKRIAYQVMHRLGKTSLGLGYGLVVTDLLLAPAIPSMTARAGGIVYPIMLALANLFTGKTHDPKMGAFLAQCAFQGVVVTSAMFITAMAGNPLIVQLAKASGVELTWTSWALAAFVPGILSLLIIPYVLYSLAPPLIHKTPHAKEMAAQHLKAMGPMGRKEKIMLATFVFLLFFWILSPYISLSATAVALFGLLILLLTGTLHWKEIIEETNAWDTFVWFSTLVTLSGFLGTFGLTQWFSHWVVGHVSGFDWFVGFCLLGLIYFYSHYFFASNVAHIGAMYAPFLIVAIALGTPPVFAALSLAFFSNLFGGLTHYSSAPAPIFFETGFASLATWWKMGFICSVLNIMIWIGIGSLWWKFLALY